MTFPGSVSTLHGHTHSQTEPAPGHTVINVTVACQLALQKRSGLFLPMDHFGLLILR